MQVDELRLEAERLQAVYGDKSLKAICGAGQVKKPDLMLVFMNPTGKNVSSRSEWQGLRAPWLGTKNAWRLFYRIGLISKNNFEKTAKFRPQDWNEQFALEIYDDLLKNGVFVTNLAKCTQIDARPLANLVFHKYLDILEQEILAVNPKKIITFGNQVSSIILGRPVAVSQYRGSQSEKLKIGEKVYEIYPVCYPVGQGMRNMPLAIKRIKAIKKA